MKELKFGKFKINQTSPILIVAEFSDGHQGNLEHAKKLVDAAQAAGADAVKFQLHFPDVEMTAGVKMWAGDLQDILKKVLFSPKQHQEIITYCQKKGIQYLCTPFSPKAIDVLEDWGVAGFKTGSGEIGNLPFQRKIAKVSAKTGKPVFISTGMCTFDELAETVAIHQEEGSNFLLMHCTSEYPITDYAHVRLGLIPVLREKFSTLVGYSDHTVDLHAAFGAAALGAKIIEKHFTLDRAGDFPDDFMSLDPQLMRVCVDGIRQIEQAMITREKTVLPEEEKIRSWASHSVVSNRNLKKGEAVTLKNVRPARPGWGIPAKYLDKRYSSELLGKKLKKNIAKNTVIKWEDLTS